MIPQQTLAEPPRSLSSEPGAASTAVDEIFLARQPILDRSGRLVAYELLFRGGRTDHAEVSEDLHASSTVVHNTLTGMGSESVLGRVVGYVNVDCAFLMSDLVDLLSPQQIVLEILETVKPTEDLIDRMRVLRSRGFRLALDDFVGFTPDVLRLLPHVDIVKIDLLGTDLPRLRGLVERLRERPVKLLAEKVETPAQFEQTRELGFDLFQGYHFARPQLLSARQHRNPDKIHLLRLLSLTMGDADIGLLEAEFKRHPMLTYNLLRMVNSPAVGIRTRIVSLGHALMLMGRRSLQNWMQLTLYTSGSPAGESAPLLQMAAVRGKLIESVMRVDPSARQSDLDTAFLTGVLSLLDALLEMPRESILQELFIADEVKEALLHRTGRLGRMLAMAELVERDDTATLRSALLEHPGMTAERLVQMQLEAFAWANAAQAQMVP